MEKPDLIPNHYNVSGKTGETIILSEFIKKINLDIKYKSDTDIREGLVSKPSSTLGYFISKSLYTSNSGYCEPPESIPSGITCNACRGDTYHTLDCRDPTDLSDVIRRRGPKAAKKGRMDNVITCLYEWNSGGKSTVKIFPTGSFLITTVPYFSKCSQIYKHLGFSKTTAISISNISAQYRFPLTSNQKFDLYEMGKHRYLITGYECLQSTNSEGQKLNKISKTTNPYIKLTFLKDNETVYVMIYNKGAVQFKGPTIELINDVYRKLDVNTIVEESEVVDKKKKIPNLIPETATVPHQSCASHDRPKPYSFNEGVCEDEPFSLVDPAGVENKKYGNYVPCCTRLCEKSCTDKPTHTKVIQRLYYGFPNGDEPIPGPPGVYQPGTKTPEDRTIYGFKQFEGNTSPILNWIKSKGMMINNIFTVSNETYILSDESDLRSSLKRVPSTLFETLKYSFIEDTGIKLDRYNQYTANFNQIPYPVSYLNYNQVFYGSKMMVIPIPKRYLEVIIFSNQNKVYIMNTYLGIREFGKSNPILGDFIVEGWISDQSEKILILTDILESNGINLETVPFYGPADSRYNRLRKIGGDIGGYTVRFPHDTNVAEGTMYYIQNNDIEHCLFKAYNSAFTPNHLNPLYFIFSKSEYIYNVVLYTTKDSVSVDGTTIPLLQNKTIPKTQIKSSWLHLCRINIGRLTKGINKNHPFTVIKRVNQYTGDSSEVSEYLGCIGNEVSADFLMSTLADVSKGV
jgi:hypothetical protein